MSLEKLYISLDTQTPSEKPEAGTREKNQRDFPGQEREPLSALEAWLTSENRRMVLLGLPGTGKSTFVRYLSLSMAKAGLSREAELPKGWKGQSLMPFMLSLGRFAETLPPDCKKGRAELVETYLMEMLESDESGKDFAPLVLRTLEREGALVMFDGLDEVANLNLRPLVVQAVEDFVLKYSRNPANYFLVTCRTYSYQHDSEWKLTGWPTHELALLSRQKVNYFVNAWYTELGQIEPARKDEFSRKQTALLNTLQPDDRRHLLDIAAFPLILTIMAVVHTHYGELPNTRAEVYERCVELLLIRWQSERSVQGKIQKQNILDALGVSPTVLFQALWEVAFRAHGEARASEQAALVTEDLLDGVMKVYLQERDRVETFLSYCQSSNGLLMLQGTLSAPRKPPRKVYAFPHLTFEEYLAARYLADQDADEYAYPLVGKSDRWREAVKLLGEHLSFGSPQRSTMSAWLEALANPPQDATLEERARMVWLAGEMLVLYRDAFPSKPAPSDARIFAQLKEQAVTPLPDPRIRANCADLADELGYLPDDLYTFIEIKPNAEVRMQNDEFRIPHSPFCISKYPVTNAQYARFLKPENFANKELWTGFPKYAEPGKNHEKIGDWGNDGWNWVKNALSDEAFQEKWSIDVENGIVLPRFWRDARFGALRSNAPLVGISWYEANAYCRWLMENWRSLPEAESLSAVDGLSPALSGSEVSAVTFRLPTEAEWVLAAGGEQNERFAFGELADLKDLPHYANTIESGINRTTPVWMYLQGKSPLEVMDMSGNVWEWQANLRGEGGFSAESRGLRGGSWDYHQGSARVSGRDFHPGYRSNGIGFRVVLLAPPS